MNKKNLPNFLIVGAAKCGTTSLADYLHQHPQIFMPDTKESKFFSDMNENYQGPGDDVALNNVIVRNLGEYEKLFSSVKNEIAIGEASPDYLFYHDQSVAKIKKILGDIKIIIILRNPVERAYSQYLHFIRDFRENLPFNMGLEQETIRRQNNWEWGWQYKKAGLYYKQVKDFLDNFSQVKIYLFDDLRTKPLNIIKDIYQFLQVDDNFVPDISRRHNVSGIPKNKFLYNLLHKPAPLKDELKSILKKIIPEKSWNNMRDQVKAKNLKKIPMDPETKKQLTKYYQLDIEKLSKLINRDLSSWIKS
ncbi:MAG: sulfotransferase [Patescibacteria group bacterium]